MAEKIFLMQKKRKSKKLTYSILTGITVIDFKSMQMLEQPQIVQGID